MRLIVCVLFLTLAIVKPASAQLCIGNPTFRDGSYQVGLGASFTNGLRTVDGTVAAGGESIFGGVGLSVLNFTDLDDRELGVTAFAGAELATDQNDRVLLCPVASLSFVPGPDVGPVDLSTAALQAGGSIGVLASQSGDMMVVPFFGLGLLYQRISTEVGGIDASVSDTGGVADLGVGLIFNRTVGITPLVSIPFATGTDDAVFTVRFTFNFGG
jgi:hypothetical protein